MTAPELPVGFLASPVSQIPKFYGDGEIVKETMSVLEHPRIACETVADALKLLRIPDYDMEHYQSAMMFVSTMRDQICEQYPLAEVLTENDCCRDLPWLHQQGFITLDDVQCAVESDPSVFPICILNRLTAHVLYHQSESDKSKFIRCKVHNYVTFPRDIFENVIDTPAVQRLRKLSQLGVASFVYPMANHTRFEHSLGCGFGAKKWCSRLADRLRISDRCPERHRIETAVEIGGICHDLGHGPYSHCFEKAIRRAGFKGWHHETMTTKIFDFMCENEPLGDLMQDLNAKDLVKKITCGVDVDMPVKSLSRSHQLERAALDIVANKRTGIDADRLDYLKRDSIGVFNKDILDASRLYKFSKIINGEICFEMKEHINIYHVFISRYQLFNTVYSHPKCRAMDVMVADMLCALEPILGISKKLDDVEEFLTLQDSLLFSVPREPSSVLTARARLAHAGVVSDWEDEMPARIDLVGKLVERIERHDLYKLAAEFAVAEEDKLKYQDTITSDICGSQDTSGVHPRFSENDIYVEWVETTDGSPNGKHPWDCVRFFTPDNPLESIRLPVSYAATYPEQLRTISLSVFCRDPKLLESVVEAVQSFCIKNKVHIDEPGDGSCPRMSPSVGGSKYPRSEGLSKGLSLSPCSSPFRSHRRFFPRRTESKDADSSQFATLAAFPSSNQAL